MTKHPAHQPAARAKAAATNRARTPARRAARLKADTEGRLRREILAEFEEATFDPQPDGSVNWKSYDPVVGRLLGDTGWLGTFKVDGSTVFQTWATEAQAEHEAWLKGEDWKADLRRERDPERWAAEVRKRNQPARRPLLTTARPGSQL
jgi:hypothetical protein